MRAKHDARTAHLQLIHAQFASKTAEHVRLAVRDFGRAYLVAAFQTQSHRLHKLFLAAVYDAELAAWAVAAVV